MPFPGCPLACRQPPSCRLAPTAIRYVTQKPGLPVIRSLLASIIPIAISLDLTLPVFAAQFGLHITPRAGVSSYGNWYHTTEPAASLSSMPHNRPDYPSLNSKPGCIKVVDTFRSLPRIRSMGSCGGSCRHHRPSSPRQSRLAGRTAPPHDQALQQRRAAAGPDVARPGRPARGSGHGACPRSQRATSGIPVFQAGRKGSRHPDTDSRCTVPAMTGALRISTFRHQGG